VGDRPLTLDSSAGTSSRDRATGFDAAICIARSLPNASSPPL
jgi:hypothetical protein